MPQQGAYPVTFNYDPSGITASGTNYLSVVRWLIGDVPAIRPSSDTTAEIPELSDQEIDAIYENTSVNDSQISRNYHTAMLCAEYLLTKYTKMASFSSGGTSVQLQERAKAWAEVVNSLRLKLLAVDGVSPMIYTDRPPSYTEYYEV